MNSTVEMLLSFTTIATAAPCKCKWSTTVQLLESVVIQMTSTMETITQEMIGSDTLISSIVMEHISTGYPPVMQATGNLTTMISHHMNLSKIYMMEDTSIVPME